MSQNPPTVLSYATPRDSRFVSAHQRATIAMAVFAVTCVVSLIWIGSNIMQLQLLSDAQQGNPPTQPAAQANDLRQLVILIAYFCAIIITAIFFVMWTYRAYKNLSAFPWCRPKFTAGKVAGSFFIPIINLYRPYQAMKELYESSDAHRHDGASIVGVWWTIWIGGGILSRVIGGSMAGRRGDVITELQSATYAAIIGAVATILAGICAIVMIRRIDQMQSNAAAVIHGQAMPLTPAGQSLAATAPPPPARSGVMR